MRRRKKPGSKEALLELTPPLIREPYNLKGSWSQYFKNNNPIHVELGMGKGRFITTLAKNNPHINYIGMEIKEEVLLHGIKKSLEGNLQNTAFIWGDIKELNNYFNSNEIARIYINFCDPWPKARHAKRRLTHRDFLALYHQVLSKWGQVHFKTDNRELFQFSLNEFCSQKWLLKNISLDLYRNPPANNVATEYEVKFVEQGLEIYRLEAIVQ